jgi:hypothetical protein
MDPANSLLRDDSLPGTLLEFARRFSTEAACARLLRRWKYGDQAVRLPRLRREAEVAPPPASSTSVGPAASRPL